MGYLLAQSMIEDILIRAESMESSRRGAAPWTFRCVQLRLASRALGRCKVCGQIPVAENLIANLCWSWDTLWRWDQGGGEGGE
jgi:hypothetical protein